MLPLEQANGKMSGARGRFSPAFAAVCCLLFEFVPITQELKTQDPGSSQRPPDIPNSRGSEWRTPRTCLPGSQAQHRTIRMKPLGCNSKGPSHWGSPHSCSAPQPLASPNHTQQMDAQNGGRATPTRLCPGTQERESCLLPPFPDSHETPGRGSRRRRRGNGAALGLQV